MLVRLIVMLIPGLAVLMLCWAGYRIYTTGSPLQLRDELLGMFEYCKNSGGGLLYSCLLLSKDVFCWILSCVLLFVNMMMMMMMMMMMNLFRLTGLTG